MAKDLLVNGELLLYGDVGDPWGFGDGFTAADVATALAEHGQGDVTARLNSGGGLAMEGMAILSLLKAHAGQITVSIDGIAASAASLIAMGGDKIQMRDGAMMMIHDPSAITLGTEQQHRAAADRLGKIADNYASVYAKRSGKTQTDVRAIMKAETWFTADDAIAEGFATDKADEPATEMAAFDYRIYAKAPRDLPVRTPKPAKGPTIMSHADPGRAPAEKPWAANFYLSAAHSRLPLETINEIVAKADDLATAKDALIDAMASAQDANKPRFSAGPALGSPEFHTKAISDAIYSRMSGKAPEGPAREWAGRSMLEMGEAVLASYGQRISGSRDQRAKAVFEFRPSMFGRGGPMMGGLSTSDFPGILGNATNRILLDSYNAVQSQIKPLSVQREANDFRSINMLRLGEPPRLDKVAEGGEVGYGSLDEMRAPPFALATFAKILPLTRQAIINDDLGAFADLARIMGKSAAQAEADAFVSLLTANSGAGMTMLDGYALYHSTHGNLASPGAGLDVAGLNTARQAMRVQKGVDGKTIIDAPPRYLLTGAALEGTAEQVISSYYPAKMVDVNPFAQKLSPLVEPRLSGNAWWLFADPTVTPCIAHAYLNGNAAPTVETKDGWTVLGVEFRVVHDFGCGLIDWRGTYRNPGP